MRLATKLLFCLGLSATLSAIDFSRDGDFQFWLHGEVSQQIGDKATLIIEPEFRFADGGSTLHFYYLQGRLLVSPTPWCDVAGGYRQIFVRPTSDDRWEPVYSPIGDLILKRQLGRANFDWRTRVQYLMFENDPNRWLFRQFYRFRTSYQIGGVTIEPTLWEEFFVLERFGINQNRFAVGIGIPTSRTTYLTLVYMLRHLKIACDWRRHNVLWLWPPEAEY